MAKDGGSGRMEENTRKKAELEEISNPVNVHCERIFSNE